LETKLIDIHFDNGVRSVSVYIAISYHQTRDYWQLSRGFLNQSLTQGRKRTG